MVTVRSTFTTPLTRGRYQAGKLMDEGIDNAIDRMLRRRLDAKGYHGPTTVRFPDGFKVFIT